MPEMMTRDKAKVLAEYDAKYARIRERLDELLASGETDLARLVANLNRERWKTKDPLEEVEAVINGQRVRCAQAVAWHGCHETIAEVLLDSVKPDTDRIIEIGAGWGFELLNLWLKGGPRNAGYVALDISDVGLLCFRTLSFHAHDRQSAMKGGEAVFDLQVDDIPDMWRSDQHALVFTCHAIEQVPQVSEDLFHRILNLAPKVTGVHIEPMQRPMMCTTGYVPTDDDPHWKRFRHAVDNDYNRNLHAVLNSLSGKGLIELDKVAWDFAGVNPDNPSSIIRWRKT